MIYKFNSYNSWRFKFSTFFIPKYLANYSILLLFWMGRAVSFTYIAKVLCELFSQTRSGGILSILLKGRLITLLDSAIRDYCQSAIATAIVQYAYRY